jgi:YVTN family beta-propeller protein
MVIFKALDRVIRICTITILLILGLVLFECLPAGAVSITEYPLPTANSFPFYITAGPDGNLWFTEPENNGDKIGKITTAGVITEYPLPAMDSYPGYSYPAGIAAGPDGNLWFTEYYGNKIGKITTAGVITEYPLPAMDSSYNGIIAGPDGNLWFSETNSNGNKIGKITTAGVFTEYPLPADSYMTNITVGPDGNLWFTENNNNGDKIGKITTAGVITEYPLSTAGSYMDNITAGPDGNLWFTETFSNKIGKITTAGVIAEYGASGYPTGITAGPDGNLWFTEWTGGNIGKITTAGVLTEFQVPTFDSYSGITVGPDGNLWFTECTGKIGRVTLAVPPTGPFAYITNATDDTVSVIDTSSNTITATIPVGSHPWGVGVNHAGNYVYVTNTNSNTVSVIDTSTNRVVATVNVGSSPVGVAVNPDGAHAYVANWGNNSGNTVSVIDTSANSVVATVNVGNGPYGIAVNPAGTRVYVSNQNSNNVSVIDTSTDSVIATVNVGNGPYGIAVNPAGTAVYVANHDSNTVSVIDTSTNSVTATVNVGNAPFEVGVNPAGTSVYVTNNNSNTLSVIDSGTNSVITTIPVGSYPVGVSTNPAGTYAYVANNGSANGTYTVSVIDTASNSVVSTIPVGNQPAAFGQFMWGNVTGGTCSVSISPTNAHYAENGVVCGMVSPCWLPSISVTTQSNCPWTAVSNDSWITIQNGNSGTGNGTVTYSVDQNTGAARTGTITVGDQTFTVTQDGATSQCTISLSPTSLNYPVAGLGPICISPTPLSYYPYIISVTTQDSCSWTAVSNNSWIAFGGDCSGSFSSATSSATFIGDTMFSLTVAPNTGPARTGTVTIGDQTFTVTQDGVDSQCTISISPTSQHFPASPIGGNWCGGISPCSSPSFTVATQSNCPWTAVSNDSWITIQSGNSGTGNGTVYYSVDQNTGAARTGTITVGGQTFTVTQDGVDSQCTISLSPTSDHFVASGSCDIVSPCPVFSFTVTAQSNCPWTAVSNDSWITIHSGDSGTGNGSVTYSVAKNTGPARTGTITAGGQTFTVTQDGVDSQCTVSISPTSAHFAADFNGCLFMSPVLPLSSFAVTAQSDCSWTGVSNDSWIRFNYTSFESINPTGIGNGNVSYCVTNNTGPARTGTVTIGDQTFTVTQDGAASTQTWTVTAMAGSGGTVSPASQTVNNNLTAIITVTPNAGYNIASVTGCGGILSVHTYTTAPITADCTVSATFEPVHVSTHKIFGIVKNVANVPLQNVVMTLSGDAGSTVYTDIQGEYKIKSLTDGNYTITLSKPGFVFAQSGQTVTISGANVHLDFVGQPISISGTVTNSAGAPMPNVLITLSGDDGATKMVYTDSNGNYKFKRLTDGTYTITPSKGVRIFTPANITVTISGASVTMQNFVGSKLQSREACGSANGQTFSSLPPSTNLCAAGVPSAVTGGGGFPWTWTCTGNDGSVAACSAEYGGGSNFQYAGTVTLSGNCTTDVSHTLPYAEANFTDSFGIDPAGNISVISQSTTEILYYINPNTGNPTTSTKQLSFSGTGNVSSAGALAINFTDPTTGITGALTGQLTRVGTTFMGSGQTIFDSVPTCKGGWTGDGEASQ